MHDGGAAAFKGGKKSCGQILHSKPSQCHITQASRCWAIGVHSIVVFVPSAVEPRRAVETGTEGALTAQVFAVGSWESNWGGLRTATSVNSGVNIRPSFARAPATVSFSTGAVSMAGGASEPGAAEYIVVYVTISNVEEGRKLAKSIVEAKLAACVNMVPGVESTYWWEGKVTTDSEVLLIAKTRQSLLGELTAFVKANHPYELPEVISLPITGGNDKYIEWLGQSTERKG
ncbi:Divalent cation tolerance-related protein [Klebsormidium nitens]|uniref:Divalent cation tolerance-related protein n=1 Tax=Klebsormidium nitens TaxID=105231 RepID=A0A1Y1I1U3_KLENI|nr:Divalent cation tolerance-related protein [Klebsormidium nitens]|eukprot:GAQ84443.1 Divalent cation tolerance-related protein [Klebsormidium nitens]